MAGIGVKLNRNFQKNTLTNKLYGMAYSAVITIAPMILVIAEILISGQVLGFSHAGYYSRELFSCTVLYIFIFGLLAASPFNTVLSKYLSDVIYEERFQDILPCYYLGLFMNLVLGCLIGVPFCLHEYFVGEVELYYVFTGFCGYIALIMIFYSMLYLSICKDYKKISLYYLIGMVTAFVLSLVFAWWFGFSVSYSMLLSLTIGFLLTACLEFARIRSYFRENSNRYRRVFKYFKDYWELVVTNFFYTLGLYIHNFVFWASDMRMKLADSFVCAQPYDMATCLAMFTNITASVIFIARVEMNFHEYYKAYSDSVIGGRHMDIEINKKRMFEQLSDELMNLARIQFIVTVVLYPLFVMLSQKTGISGLTMRIYPCLAAGYFILFIMYAEIVFLYYFNDLKGAALTAVLFCLGTFVFSIMSSHMSELWYGLGILLGSFIGWTCGYMRLRWVERNLDTHVFCRGTLLKPGMGEKPSGKVYDVYEKLRREQQNNKRSRKRKTG